MLDEHTRPIPSRAARHSRRAPLPQPPGHPSWALLPLRLFLGLTFLDAGIGKLLAPAWFGTGPDSLASQAGATVDGSPIGGLVRGLVVPHPGLFAWLIAVAELAAGLLTLVGLASRVAAAAGLLLSLSFFLTVSFQVRPFFYGADVVFVFAWAPLLLAGDAGLPSVDRWLLRRALLGDAGGNGAGDPDGGAGERRASRRALLGALGAAGVTVAGLAALLGRSSAARSGSTAALGAPRSTARSAASRPSGTLKGEGATTAHAPATRPRAPSTTAAPAPTTTAAPPMGLRIGSLADVAVGQARTFTDPGTGKPAVAIRLTSSKVVAFSAKCTHAGCVVQFDTARKVLQCPCHGGQFNPAAGAAVVAGPPPRPLPAIPVRLSADGGIYVE